MPEPTTMEGVLRALVEAVEARECAEPDLPEWESSARVREAEANLLQLYRQAGHPSGNRGSVGIEVAHSQAEATALEVA